MAFWGIHVKPGEPYTLKPDIERRRLRITQATLALPCEAEIRRSVLQCAVGNKPPISICSLSMKDQDSCQLNIEFDESEDVVFSIVGSHGVYLAGSYIFECVAGTSDCAGANGFILNYCNSKASREEENVAICKTFTTEADVKKEDKKFTTEEIEKGRAKNTISTEVGEKRDRMLSAMDEEDIGDTDSFTDGSSSSFCCSEDFYDLSDSFIDDSYLYNNLSDE